MMNLIEKLLDGFDVELKPLGDLGELIRGNGLPKKDFTDSGVPAIHYGQIYTYYGLSTSDTKSFVSEETARKLKKVSKGDVIITNTSENFKDVGKALVYLGDEEAVTGGHASIFKPTDLILGKYLAYFFQSKMFEVEKRKYAKGIKVIDVSTKDLAKILIPLPPLDVQHEIVEILDIFTPNKENLICKLRQELDLRKKQYEVYRDRLLDFSEQDVVWKGLAEACDYADYRGKTPKKSDSGIFLVTAKNIRMGYIDYQKSQEFIPEEDYENVMRRGLPGIGDVLITTEAPCGYVAQIDREDIALAQRVIKYRSKDDSLLHSFLKHYLLSGHFQYKLHKASTGSTVKGIKGSKLHKLTIPIPDVSTQKELVGVLDKLESLTSEICKKIEFEMDSRVKQYNYYRNLLFTSTLKKNSTGE